jgi:hypothetical protein
MSEQTPDNGNANPPERERGERPLRVIRDGSIASSIWERPGQDGPNYSAKVVRNWKDEDGKFHESNSYSEYDLPRLAEVARNTRDVISGLRHEQSQNRDPQNQKAPDRGESREQYVGQRQSQTRNSTRTRKR